MNNKQEIGIAGDRGRDGWNSPLQRLRGNNDLDDRKISLGLENGR